MDIYLERISAVNQLSLEFFSMAINSRIEGDVTSVKKLSSIAWAFSALYENHRAMSVCDNILVNYCNIENEALYDFHEYGVYEVEKIINSKKEENSDERKGSFDKEIYSLNNIF